MEESHNNKEVRSTSPAIKNSPSLHNLPFHFLESILFHLKPPLRLLILLEVGVFLVVGCSKELLGCKTRQQIFKHVNPSFDTIEEFLLENDVRLQDNAPDIWTNLVRTVCTLPLCRERSFADPVIPDDHARIN
ncbi:hypothetical protein Dsin_023135 [Dipteronia sinensis]|uniref:DUF7086 domain-containing protein n=1 Tax=Dipteronia sinensis TaxID=43782 RepID=A0AAE0E0E3_9ROSI|nr:hypothetical protein Dsin_023135 [Dipteronia sinensis]